MSIGEREKKKRKTDFFLNFFVTIQNPPLLRRAEGGTNLPIGHYFLQATLFGDDFSHPTKSSLQGVESGYPSFHACTDERRNRQVVLGSFL